MGGWWSGLCGRFAALAASAFGVGSVSAATGGIRSGGMMMGLSGGRSGVYGGGEAKIANRSLAAASSARAAAVGVHPLELSLDCHMLCHVSEGSSLLVPSLSGDSEDESGWLCPWLRAGRDAADDSEDEFPWRSNHVVDAGGIGASSAVSSASGGCVVHVHACLPCGVNCHPGWLGNAGALCHACEALSPSAGWSQPFLCCHDVAGYVVSATVVVGSWACQWAWSQALADCSQGGACQRASCQLLLFQSPAFHAITRGRFSTGGDKLSRRQERNGCLGTLPVVLQIKHANEKRSIVLGIHHVALRHVSDLCIMHERLMDNPVEIAANITNGLRVTSRDVES